MKQMKGLTLHLNLDVNLINDAHESKEADKYQFGDSTYRQDGVTIGKDYFRVEGTTISRGELTTDSVTINTLIGEGAFSKVYSGTLKQRKQNGVVDDDDDENIMVAIKQCCVVDSEPHLSKMLIKELRTLCRVNCDNLLQFHGAFLNDGTLTMILEFMDCGSLESMLENNDNNNGIFSKKNSGQYIAAFAYQMLSGLAFLHRKKIVHRDIKPGNVLLNSDGYVKLCDFGISSLGDRTLSTTVVGTSVYMAPERLRAKRYGRSSDLWSFGLVLLECLTGSFPWKHISSIVALVMTIEEISLDDLIPGSLESNVQEVLHGCLQKEPAKRFPAGVIMHSPWLAEDHNIQDISDAIQIMATLFLMDG